jgi:hypothetical protein
MHLRGKGVTASASSCSIIPPSTPADVMLYAVPRADDALHQRGSIEGLRELERWERDPR